MLSSFCAVIVHHPTDLTTYYAYIYIQLNWNWCLFQVHSWRYIQCSVSLDPCAYVSCTCASSIESHEWSKRNTFSGVFAWRRYNMVQLITNFQHVTLQFTFTCNTYHIIIYIYYTAFIDVLCDMCLSVPRLQGTYARKFDAFSHRCRTHPRIFQLADRLCLRELKADHVGCLPVFSTKLLRWKRLKPPRKSWALKICEWFPFF